MSEVISFENSLFMRSLRVSILLILRFYAEDSPDAFVNFSSSAVIMVRKTIIVYLDEEATKGHHFVPFLTEK